MMTTLKYVGVNVWLVVVAMLTPINCYAQRQDTVYQTLTFQSLSILTTRNLGPVTNIGQSSHQAVIRLENRPTKTCDTTVVGFYTVFLGNYVNDTATAVQLPFTTFESPTNVTANGIGVIMQANNAYPFVWVQINFTAPDFTNCFYSVFYTGTIAPGVISTQSLYTNQAFISNEHSLAMGANLMIATLPLDKRYAKFYIVEASATTATDLVFSCAGGTTGISMSIPAETTIILPYSNIPYMNCPINVAATVTASTGTAILHLWYLYLHTFF